MTKRWDVPDKMMIHILGGTEREGMEFYQATWNSTQFKHELLISGIFHLIFSDHDGPHVTETAESETTDEWGDAICLSRNHTFTEGYYCKCMLCAL